MAQRLRAPRAAGVAGVIFSVILGAVILLMQVARPAVGGDLTWVLDPSRREAMARALALVPFAGIAFLWFIGVVRAQVGRSEDRFVETVFLGSGLLFIGTLFTTAASLTAVLRLDAVAPVSPENAAAAMAFGSSLLGQFGTRMAAVFALTLTTAARLGGTLPGWLVALGYVVGLALLLSPPFPTVTQFAFPVWVAALSITVLLRRREAAPAADGAAA